MEEHRKLVDLLRKKLEETPMSQAKFAQLADLHPSTVSNILTGNLKPWSKQVAKMEAAMRKLDWFGDDVFGEVGSDV